MEKFILDLRDVPQELILIIEMLKNNKIDIIEDYIRKNYKDIDWKMFLELTKHHRLYPLLSSKLQSLDERLVPQFVVQNVSSLYKKNIFKMLQLSGEMEKLANLFSNYDIKSIFLKGPILGNEIYGDISLRACGDLDILIPIEGLDKMHNLLEENGYEKDDYIKSVLGDWKWRHHHLTYYHTLKNIKIEIHWRLHPGPGKEPRFNELWERKRKYLNSNNNIYLLGREDLFLFLVSHGARHGWSRLRWLIDIQKIIAQGMDWQKIFSVVKKHHNFHVVGQSLILSSQFLGTKITKEMQRFITDKRAKSLAQDAIYYIKNMINLHNGPLQDDVFIYHVRHLYSLKSRHQKILYILSYFYPFHIDTLTFPLPKKLHFLYFIIRPFLCLWRRVKKQELSLGETK